MINLPDDLLLQKITKQHLYCDKKSKDPFNNKIKPKYKLAGNCILEYYFFHVLTKDKDACKQVCTLSLCLKDWENRAKQFKMEPIGYCDLTKYERIKEGHLLNKIKDRGNGFPYVAKLNDLKYKKLLKLRKNLYKQPYITKETKDIIEVGLSPSVDEILKKLNLD